MVYRYQTLDKSSIKSVILMLLTTPYRLSWSE